MKKKIVSIALVVAMLAIAVAGGTFAYLTDTDVAKNVMVVGNLNIEQIEMQRAFDEDGNYTGNLEAFESNKTLRPAVYHDDKGNVVSSNPAYWHLDTYTTAGETNANLIGTEVIANQIDKIVYVENEGTEDAYIRTVFLWQDDIDPTDNIHYADKIANAWTETGSGEKDTGHYNWLKGTEDTYVTIKVDGVNYIATVHYYNDVLEAGATSKASLKSFWVTPEYDTTTFPATYNVLALTQAVQADGFADDHEALDAAFGEFTADNIAEWFGGTVVNY